MQNRKWLWRTCPYRYYFVWSRARYDGESSGGGDYLDGNARIGLSYTISFQKDPLVGCALFNKHGELRFELPIYYWKRWNFRDWEIYKRTRCEWECEFTSYLKEDELMIASNALCWIFALLAHFEDEVMGYAG